MAKLELIYCKRKNKNVLSQKVTIDSIDEKYCLLIGCKYKVSYENNILAVFTNNLAFCTSEAVRQMIPRLTRWENMWGETFLYLILYFNFYQNLLLTHAQACQKTLDFYHDHELLLLMAKALSSFYSPSCAVNQYFFVDFFLQIKNFRSLDIVISKLVIITVSV